MMLRANDTARVGATWFAIASFLMILVFLLHGPISPDLTEQMARITGGLTRWAVAHWIAAAGLSLYTVAGLIVLTSRSELTASWWTTTAWAVIPVAALWTLTTAIAEATVVTNAARAANTELFDAWWAFAEGKANGFAFLALAIAVIASSDARSAARATPAWAGWAAMVAGILSFSGWALAMWFGIAPASLLWVVSSIVMCAWAVWFGLAISRSPAGAMAG